MTATTPPEPPDPPAPPIAREGKVRLGLREVATGTAALAALTVMGAYVFGGLEGLSTGGVMALILGVTLSYALGVGLMAAIFHSSRFHDDSAHNAARDQFKDRHRNG